MAWRKTGIKELKRRAIFLIVTLTIMSANLALDVDSMMTFGTYDDNATSWMSGAVRDYWVRVGDNLTKTPAAVWQATRAEYGY